MIWSAPYSYSTAPIELLFGGLKLGELNPERQPTGKKVSAYFSLHFMLAPLWASPRCQRSKIAEFLIP